jgi:hypothetical protein
LIQPAPTGRSSGSGFSSCRAFPPDFIQAVAFCDTTILYSGASASEFHRLPFAGIYFPAGKLPPMGKPQPSRTINRIKSLKSWMNAKMPKREGNAERSLNEIQILPFSLLTLASGCPGVQSIQLFAFH